MILIKNPIGKRRRIPLMPLIDVIFILVMFFLLSSTFGVWRPLEVSLGEETHTSRETERSDLGAPSILIAYRPAADQSQEVLTVNGIDVSLEQLSAELDRLASLGAESAILVPTEGTEFQQVINILDEARSSRLKKVSLKLE
ncbi:MAG: biopolymer transporter ExbD [Pseudomonadota bacterium]